MSCTCGCCEGVAIAVPGNTANRPGLPALACRVGTHATFLETMIARLSSHDFPELAALTTRNPADPSIALLDSWALVADVLTFYQERIANEGYLGTATERRSVLELARLIGYKLRPGVAASVYLAYTLAEDLSKTPPLPTRTIIPAGSRSQSVPSSPGEVPQSFETSDDLEARSEWNDLSPRLTRPQLITLDTDFGTNASTRDGLYFSGIETNLKIGDALLITFGERPVISPPQQFLRVVESVDVQADQKRTEVVLQPDSTPAHDFDSFKGILEDFYTDATTVFGGSNVSAQVAALLHLPPGSPAGSAPGILDLIADAKGTMNFAQLAGLVRTAIPPLQQMHELAVKRNFTRLGPWLTQRLDQLDSFIQKADGFAAANPDPLGKNPLPAGTLPSPLGSLAALLKPLSRPASIQPRSSLQLNRSVAATFSPQSDLAPKLLGAFKPSAAPDLYTAWENLQTPASQVEVFSFRIKASLFASNFVGAAVSTVTPVPPPNDKPVYNTHTEFTPPTFVDAWDGAYLSLDAVYDKIRAESWIAILSPNLTADGTTDPNNPVTTTYHKVEETQTASVSTQDTSDIKGGGFIAKVTRLKLNPPWNPSAKIDKEVDSIWQTRLLRQTSVYAQAEPLILADEPLDIDIEGDKIDLDGVYSGLNPGRWIIVSGERTDVPNVTGIKASELVMVAGVEQGSHPLFCAAWPSALFPIPPFAAGYRVTSPNKFGDRLIVGKLALDLPQNLSPEPPVSNQQYCDQVELAPGLWINAYVPTDKEAKSQFADFDGLLIDPVTGRPVSNNVAAGIGGAWGNKKGNFWAWRIPSEKVHTILTLANKLAYTYDPDSVILYGNVVKATNGETRKEVLGNGDGSQSFQQFALKQKPLTFVSASNPSGTDSTLKVYVNNIEWHETDGFAGLGPKDRSYVTQATNDDTLIVNFGNGREGPRLPTGTGNVMGIYRNGIGKAGNVDAAQITLLQSRPLNVKDVINPLRASGGADRDSRDQARRNAPLAVMALDRLVSVPDYADFARTFAGIGKASSARLTDGQRELVHVTVAGADDIPLDYTSDLHVNLVRALRVNGDPYLPLQVAVRRLRLLVISANVKILPDRLWDPVVTAIRSALLDTFSFDRRSLGQPAFLSEAISIIQGVDGVSYVDVDKFDSIADDVTPEQLAGLAGTLELKKAISSHLAKVNRTPVNYPDDSILPAELVYMTPDIPETLILNEVKS